MVENFFPKSELQWILESGFSLSAFDGQYTHMTPRMARILLVEDDPGYQAAIRTALEIMGHAVTTSEDGEDALEKLNSSSYDLILTGVEMPRLDGLGFIRQKIARGISTPIILFTATETITADLLKELKVDPADFFPKPLEMTRFLARIRSRLKMT